MSQYIQLFFGFWLGALLMASMSVYDYQKNKSIEYKAAVKAYLKAEVGYYVIAAVGLMTLLFILSEFINLSITREDLMKVEKKNYKQMLQLYFKTTSVGLGLFIQYIAFAVRKKGKEAIDKAAQ